MIRRTILFLLVTTAALPLAAARQRAASHLSPCTMSVSPRTVTVPASGGTVVINVSASGSCGYTAKTNSEWLAPSAVVSPGGNELTFVVVGNSANVPRVTTIDIGGVIVTVTQAAAEVRNLIVNPAFDRDLSGWFTTFSTGAGSASWSALDANGAANSGSAQIQSTQGGAGYQLLQCVNILPNRIYEYGLKARIARGQDPAGRVILGVYEYDVADCNKVGYGDNRQQFINPPLDTWTPTSYTFVSSSNTKSVYFVIAAGLHKTPPFAINFDDAFLREKQ